MLSKASFELSEELFSKILKKKEKMGFKDKKWAEWFTILLDLKKNETEEKIIERVFKEGTTKYYFDTWVKNFALNLQNIWNGNSVKKLSPKKNRSDTSAIIIGRGPSIKKYNHLEKLAKSNFKGTIICTDGAMPNVLKAGITPKKFKKFFVVTVDAEPWQQDFYKHPLCKKFGSGIKCIISTTADPKVYEAAVKSKMKVFWTHTLFDYDKNKISFNKLAGMMVKAKNKGNGLPAIQTGGNVGTACWIVAWTILKIQTISLIGIDHGYYTDIPWEKMKNYHSIPFPKGVNQKSKEFKKAYPTIYNPYFNCYCKQDPIFVYFSNALKEFCKRKSQTVKTINATEGGVIFGEGIECMTFENFLKKYKQ